MMKEFLKDTMPESLLKRWLLPSLSLLGAVLSAWGSGLLLPLLKEIEPLLLLQTIGAIAWLAAVLLAYICFLLFKLWARDDEKYREAAQRRKLSKETFGILKFIAHIEKPFSPEGIPTKEFCIFGLSEQELKYHFEEMKSAGCLKFNSDAELVGISDKGRALLHNKKMLPKYQTENL